MSLALMSSADARVAKLEEACHLVGDFISAAAAYDRHILGLIQEIQGTADRLRQLQTAPSPVFRRMAGQPSRALIPAQTASPPAPSGLR